MLSKLLTVANPTPAIVGFDQATVAASSTPSYSLTGLFALGGLGSAPIAGDLVVAAIAFKDATDRDITCTTSGYTELADLFQSATNSIQLGVFYKRLTTAETSIAFNIGAAVNSYFAVHVWRNVAATQPDATTTTSQGTTAQPNAPSITTTIANAVVIAIGAGAASATNPIASGPSGGYSNSNDAKIYDEVTAGIIMNSTFKRVPGAEDPPTFSSFNANVNNAVCAATVAIRPTS